MNDNYEHDPFGMGYDTKTDSEIEKETQADVQRLPDWLKEPIKAETVSKDAASEESESKNETITTETDEKIEVREATEATRAWSTSSYEPTTRWTVDDVGTTDSGIEQAYHKSPAKPSPVTPSVTSSQVTPPVTPSSVTPPVTPSQMTSPMTPQRMTPPPVTPTPTKSPKAKKKKKKGGFFTKILVCVVLALIFGGVSGCVFVSVNAIGTKLLGLENESGPASEIPEIPKVGPAAPEENILSREPGKESTEASASASGELTVAQVAERCMPAMVAITNTSIAEIPNYFGFGSQSYESTSSGSGIIIDQNDTELLIATNNHVISGANTLTVAFIDDTLVEAIVKGTDVQNDLAVVSVKLTDIPSETLAQIRVIEIGDSDALSVGDQVVAIGNALGYGQSVSSGWVSALDREVTIDNTTLTLLQTDAAINPGNSGGALLNMRGELVAINESKYADTSVEGMGYAIPVSTATPILAELMSKTTRYKVEEDQASYLGISCKDISPDFAMMYNVPTGVYVDSVEENGPAALAGIKKGDIITKFDGTTLSSYTDLVGQLEYYAAGEVIEVVVARAHMGDYQEETLTVTLGLRNDSEFLQQ